MMNTYSHISTNPLYLFDLIWTFRLSFCLAVIMYVIYELTYSIVLCCTDYYLVFCTFLELVYFFILYLLYIRPNNMLSSDKIHLSMFLNIMNIIPFTLISECNVDSFGSILIICIDLFIMSIELSTYGLGIYTMIRCDTVYTASYYLTMVYLIFYSLVYFVAILLLVLLIVEERANHICNKNTDVVTV